MSVSNVLYAQDELCTDGILLFREDFGGNDVNDPAVSRTAVPGMSYRQVTNDALESMGAGKYLVTKCYRPLQSSSAFFSFVQLSIKNAQIFAYVKKKY